MTQPTENVPPRRPLIPRQRVASGVLAVLAATAITAGTTSSASAATNRATALLRTEVNTLTSTARKLAGCRPLVISSRLDRSAQQHASEMAAKDYFSHSSADGTSWIKRIKRAGYKQPGGENIAQGFPTAASVLLAWMNSPDHRANILDCQFRKIGIGWAGPNDYWVQDFGY